MVTGDNACIADNITARFDECHLLLDTIISVLSSCRSVYKKRMVLEVVSKMMVTDTFRFTNDLAVSKKLPRFTDRGGMVGLVFNVNFPSVHFLKLFNIGLPLGYPSRILCDNILGKCFLSCENIVIPCA